MVACRASTDGCCVPGVGFTPVLNGRILFMKKIRELVAHPDRGAFPDWSATRGMDLLVVGAGEVGRWFAATVDADTAFTDRDPVVARDAAAAIGGRAVPLDGDEQFDAVCVAVPIPVAADTVREHACRADEAILDVTGVMEPVLAAMRDAAPDIERVSLHPLFAPANGPGHVAAAIDADGPVTDAVLDRLDARGNTVFETTATEHDEAMRTVQAKAHTAVLAFALSADDVREEFHTPVSGPLTALVETVTGGDPRVYADIQRAFDGASEVAAAAARLAEADPESFESLHRDARDRPAGEE